VIRLGREHLGIECGRMNREGDQLVVIAVEDDAGAVSGPASRHAPTMPRH